MVNLVSGATTGFPWFAEGSPFALQLVAIRSGFEISRSGANMLRADALSSLTVFCSLLGPSLPAFAASPSRGENEAATGVSETDKSKDDVPGEAKAAPDDPTDLKLKSQGFYVQPEPSQPPPSSAAESSRFDNDGAAIPSVARVRGFMIAGGALLGYGAAFAVLGGVMLEVPVRTPECSGWDCLGAIIDAGVEKEFLSIWGTEFLILGGVVAVVGAALLIYGNAKRLERNERLSLRNLSVALEGRTGSGVVMYSIRF